MENETIQTPKDSSINTGEPKAKKKKKEMNPKLAKILGSSTYSYIFLSAVLVYLLLSGFVVFFSGDLFIEGIIKKGFLPGSSDYDQNTFLMGYLYGFAGMCGLMGGISVLTTRPRDYAGLKLLFFLPSVFWSLMLFLDAFRWGTEYMGQFLYLTPALLVSVFLAYSVHMKVAIPLYRD